MATHVKKNLLTVEDLWACARIGSTSISPDGKWAVADVATYSMEKNDRASALWLFSTDGKTRKRLTQAGKKDAAPVWSPDGKTIAFTAQRDDDTAPQVYVIDPLGGEAQRITTLSTGLSALRWFPDSKRLCAVSSVWPDLANDKAQASRAKARKEAKVQAHVIEQDTYRYWDHWIDSGTVHRLFEITIANGKVRDLLAKSKMCLSPFDAGTGDYAISPDGAEIIFARPRDPLRTQEDSDLYLLNVNTCGAKRWLFEDGYSFSGPSYSPDGKRVACVRVHNRSKPEHDTLWIVNRKSPEKREQWLSKWDRSVGSYGGAVLRWSCDSSNLLFCGDSDGYVNINWIKPGETAPKVLVKGGTIHNFDMAADKGKLIYVRCSMMHPAQLMAYDFNTDSTVRLDRFNDTLLKNKSMGRVESRTFDGHNKASVQAFVVYPPNYDARKKYPLLQQIHGGPHVAFSDTWHYRWNVQLFATQGYVVAAVNYHGSPGFGQKFLASIEGDLGKREFADIEGVTDQLIKKNIVDKNRLFAAGGSYGGYMVAYMNGHTDRYKAYVCHAGVYDWIGQYGDDGYLWLKYELGKDYFEDFTHVAKQSPHFYARNFKTPTLVIHGELDYRVPYYEGLQYYNTLRAKGVSARLVVYPDENHWILKPQNSRLWYKEFFAWLKRFDQ
jgi:dipeptidyl aminopeptidase/acylaminoacyl peptidase